jgi:Uma2 family endonuclease
MIVRVKHANPRSGDLDPPPIRKGEPVWPLARLYPHQGDWTEDRYLDLNASFLVELSGGCLEFPSMPTIAHQLIVLALFRMLDAFVSASKAGIVLVAPLPVRLWPDKAREPDIAFIRPGRPRYRGKYPEGADLVVEVVSEDEENRVRDLVTKRREYAAAGIPEYWIVDPQEQQVTVLTLEGALYREHGVFTRGQTAGSLLLPGFSADVTAVLDAPAAAA